MARKVRFKPEVVEVHEVAGHELIARYVIATAQGKGGNYCLREIWHGGMIGNEFFWPLTDAQERVTARKAEIAPFCKPTAGE